MTVKTYNHPGGFTYIKAEDIQATYGIEVMVAFAKWCSERPCPDIRGVTAAYYTDFKEFTESR